MVEGYHGAGDGNCSHSRLDELCCEYVDGTMDANVRRVFEEYLQIDANLREQVIRLRHARELLCARGCPPPGGCRAAQARLRRRLACELMHEAAPWPSGTADHLATAVGVTSATVVLVLVGMFLGLSLADEPQQAADRPAMAYTMPASALPMTPLRPAVPRVRSTAWPADLATSASVPQVLMLDDTRPMRTLQRTHGAP